METYEEIEIMMAAKYGADTTARKAVGDFMLSETHAVNVKSNNVHKQNYSPNMISIKKLHKWVYENRNQLSFLFVDYEIQNGKIVILSESATIPVEEISWDCLSIEAQGYGVIQKVCDLVQVKGQTKRQFYEGFLKAYKKFRGKETAKHDRFQQKFIQDLDTIDW